MTRSGAAAAAVALAFLAFGATASGLDGKTFHGAILDDQGVERANDVVSVKDGKFQSVNCERFGFGEAPYWMRVEGDIVHFFVEMTHPDNGTRCCSKAPYAATTPNGQRSGQR